MTSTIAGLSVPSADLCHVQWRSLAWVLENGPLNEKNAMEYFSHSPFYDRRSTNQVLRMQSMFSGQPPLEPEAEKEALKKLVGVEYSLVLSKPEPDREGGLFVVEKRDRKSFDESHPIASYYILKTCIYQSPSFHATLSCRLITSLSSLSDLLTLARAHKPFYDARQEYTWKIKAQDNGPEGESSNTDLQPDISTNGSSIIPEAAVESTSRLKDEALEAENHPMEIDDDPAPDSKTRPIGSEPTRNLETTGGVRNMILERAFHATAAIFALPESSSSTTTQPVPTISEVPNISSASQETAKSPGDLGGSDTINSGKTSSTQVTSNVSLASLTNSSGTSLDSSTLKTSSKGLVPGKRKLKRTSR